jgi:hypothetical protein
MIQLSLSYYIIRNFVNYVGHLVQLKQRYLIDTRVLGNLVKLGEMSNTYRIFMGKSQDKHTFHKLRRRWNIILTSYGNILWRYEVDETGLRACPVKGSIFGLCYHCVSYLLWGGTFFKPSKPFKLPKWRSSFLSIQWATSEGNASISRPA